jgi:hypothetical protein
MTLRTGLWIPSEVIERALERAKGQGIFVESRIMDMRDALRYFIMEELEAEQ